MKKKNKISNYALITGGSSGIGASFAMKLSELGHDIIIVSSNRKKLSTTLNKIQKKFDNKVMSIQCDLSEENSCNKIAKIIKSKKIKIDFFIHCAGVGYYGKFIKSNLNYNFRILDINIKSTVALNYIIAKHMLLHGNNSTIVNVGSLAGFCPSPEMTVYSASKKFIENFTRCLSYELKNSKIKVAYLAPGQTNTNFLKNFKKNINKKNSMEASRVTQIALNKINANKSQIITGYLNYIRYLIFKVVPSSIIMKYFYYKMLNKK